MRSHEFISSFADALYSEIGIVWFVVMRGFDWGLELKQFVELELVFLIFWVLL